ncbi:MAG: hypothetical protein ACAI35_24805 [Candidatus Methylacidiphilales bacterium]|nr:hypothetical protein [Candidatus Methylacidiphilales bacterium]
MTLPANWQSPLATEPVEKTTDVFFSGAMGYSWERESGRHKLAELLDEATTSISTALRRESKRCRRRSFCGAAHKPGWSGVPKAQGGTACAITGRR